MGRMILRKILGPTKIEVNRGIEIRMNYMCKIEKNLGRTDKRRVIFYPNPNETRKINIKIFDTLLYKLKNIIPFV